VNILHKRLNCIDCNKFWSEEKGGIDDDSLRIFVVNLDRRPDRWAAVQDQLSKLKAFMGDEDAGGELIVQRISAVDGSKLDLRGVDPATIELGWKWGESALADKYGDLAAGGVKQLTMGEVGCALSHIGIWRQIASQPIRGPALILEDDVLLDDDAAVRLRSYAAQLPAGWDLVYLGGIKMGRAKHMAPNVILPECYLCTHGYMLSPNGAKRLLTRLPVQGPVDHFMSECFRYLNTFAFQPPLAHQPQHLHGHIESEDSDVTHNLQRVQYTGQEQSKPVKDADSSIAGQTVTCT